MSLVVRVSCSWAGRLLVCLVGLAGLLAEPARAEEIEPTTLADDSVANGNCTLREAVQAANADAQVDACLPGSGADRIELLRGTHALSVSGPGEDASQTGDLDITGDLTVVGDLGGSVVDGAGIDRIFHVHSGQLSLEIVTVKGGDPRAEEAGVPVSATTGDGGAVLLQAGALRVWRSTLAYNHAVDGAAVASQGGAVNVETSTLSDNIATGGGGGVYAASAPVEITMSTVAGNGAGQGSSFRLSGSASVLVKGSILGIACGDVSEAVASEGYNVFDGRGLSDCQPSHLQPSDVWDGRSYLSELADVGGPTPTRAFGLPLPSDALGSGPPASDPDCGGQVDQRGIPRPRPADRPNCDIGAFEYEALHPYCETGRFIFVGTEARDTLSGSDERDLLLGELGRDSLLGLGAGDCLDGGAGKDKLRGGEGDDVLYGAAGRDRLRGQSGRDELYGGSGGGKLNGGPGDDLLLDALLIFSQDIPIGSIDHAVLKGGKGDDAINGWYGDDEVSGGPGRDTIQGGRGRDRIRCGAGRDRVVRDADDEVARDCEKVKRI
jgi:CSLREA domain-containing protein